jgi:hypothetical protein
MKRELGWEFKWVAIERAARFDWSAMKTKPRRTSCIKAAASPAKETPVGKIRLIDQPSRSTIEFAESAKSRRTAGWNVG